MCVPVCVQLCPTLWPFGLHLSGSSVHGILWAGILDWVCHFLLQGIFLSQGLNPCLLRLLHCRQTLYPLSSSGSPANLVMDIKKLSFDSSFQFYLVSPNRYEQLSKDALLKLVFLSLIPCLLSPEKIKMITLKKNTHLMKIP